MTNLWSISLDRCSFLCRSLVSSQPQLSSTATWGLSSEGMLSKIHFKYQNLFCFVLFCFVLWKEFFPPTSWKDHLSPVLALCVFLVCERHRGEGSDWFPYIDVLPTSYTCPAYFTDKVMAVLPPYAQRTAREQREAVQKIYSSNKDFFRCVSQKNCISQWL